MTIAARRLNPKTQRSKNVSHENSVVSLIRIGPQTSSTPEHPAYPEAHNPAGTAPPSHGHRS